MYSMDKCPICGFHCPSNKEELDKILFNTGRQLILDELDEWYCFNCSHSFINYYTKTELSWYDPAAIGYEDPFDAQDDLFDSLEYFICCDTYADGCACVDSVSYDLTVVNLGIKGILESDFYDLDELKPGVDCSSCTKYASEMCDKFNQALLKVARKEGTPQSVITPCSEYHFSQRNSQIYHFGATTGQAVVVQYPETRKVEHTNA